VVLTQHIKRQLEQNAELFIVKPVGTLSNDQAVKGQTCAVCQWRQTSRPTEVVLFRSSIEVLLLALTRGRSRWRWYSMRGRGGCCDVDRCI